MRGATRDKARTTRWARFAAGLAIGLLCLTEAGAQAQAFKRELSAGASFGVNFASVSFSPRVPTKMSMGFNGGGTIRWITEPHLGLQAEVNFTQNGWAEKFETQPQYHYARTLNYIELPFLTHIYFGNRRVRFFVNLGPKVGYLLSESTDSNLNGTNPNPNRPDEQHTLGVQKRFDWGLCGGPGLEIRTGIGSFLVEGRYYYALGDIFNSRKADPFPKSAGQVISAKLTYLIPLRRY